MMKNLYCSLSLIIMSFSFSVLRSQTCEWIKTFGNKLMEGGAIAVVTEGGDNIVTSNFKGTITIGSNTLSGPDTIANCIFIAKNDSTGNNIWAKAIYARYSGTVSRLDTKVDVNGNFFLLGQYSDTADFGGGTKLVSTSPFDAFLAKYDASGNLKWVRTLTSRGSGKVALDNAGNPVLYVSAGVNMVVKIQGSPDSLVYGNKNAVALIKYNSDGSFNWAKKVEIPSQNISFYSMAVDAIDNIYFFGNAGPLSLDSVSLVGTGGVILKTNATGAIINGIKVENAVFGNAYVYSDGRIITSVNVTDSADFGSGKKVKCKGPLSSGVIVNSTLAFYNADLSCRWIMSEDRSSMQLFSILSILAIKDDIYVTGGMYGGETKFGNVNFTVKGGNMNGFIIKLDSTQNIDWSIISGSSLALPITPPSFPIDRTHNFLVGGVDRSGSIYFSGRFSDTLAVFNDTAYANRAGDAVVFKISPVGLTSGVKKHVDNVQISIYPNPTTDNIFIQTARETRDAEARIYDILGKQVLQTKLSDNIVEISLKSLLPGTYTVNVIEDGFVMTGKLIVKQ